MTPSEFCCRLWALKAKATSAQPTVQGDQQETTGSTAKPKLESEWGQADSALSLIGLSSPLLVAPKSLACGRFDSHAPDGHCLRGLERQDGGQIGKGPRIAPSCDAATRSLQDC